MTAMEKTYVGHTRLERYKNCGTSAWVEWSPSARRHRVRSCNCKDRWCPACGRTRADHIRAHLAKLCKGKDVRFITLTLRQAPGSLRSRWDRLQTCWRNIREHSVWLEHVTASACVVEIKRSRDGKSWHPHLHILTTGKYFPTHLLSSVWLGITGDSPVVDVRKVPASAGVAYVTKYMMKPTDDRTMDDPEWLAEFITTAGGRRMINFTGGWRGERIQKKDAEITDWKPIASLVDTVAAARRNEKWAIAVISSLRAPWDRD